jgi:hypothetical protein
MTRIALLSACLLVGCGGGLTRTQIAARAAGVAFLDPHSECPADQISVRGRDELFHVQACLRRVDVRCVWGSGAPSCTPQPVLDAADEARATRARDAREEARRVAVAPPPPSAPRPAAPAAAFHVGSDGVLQMDAVEGFLEIRVRASSAHPERVLVSSTLVSGDDAACDHALVLSAAGETSRIEAEQRDGATAHYLFDAAELATLGDRTPIRMSVCGQTIAFGHPALRALRAFIAADAALRE